MSGTNCKKSYGLAGVIFRLMQTQSFPTRLLRKLAHTNELKSHVYGWIERVELSKSQWIKIGHISKVEKVPSVGIITHLYVHPMLC